MYEKEQARHRDKYYRLGYKEKHKPDADKKRFTMDKYKAKYPEKDAARRKLYSVRDRKEGFEYHHWNYNDDNFLDVIELTAKEHSKSHRFIIYDQERKMYRRCDTNVLLDTKEAHEEFIRNCIANKHD